MKKIYSTIVICLWSLCGFAQNINRLLAKVLLCCIGINECDNESNSKPKTRMATIVVLC